MLELLYIVRVQFEVFVRNDINNTTELIKGDYIYNKSPLINSVVLLTSLRTKTSNCTRTMYSNSNMQPNMYIYIQLSYHIMKHTDQINNNL